MLKSLRKVFDYFFGEKYGYSNKERAMTATTINNAPIRYSIIHPSHPLKMSVSPPVNKTDLKFTVDRYSGGGFAENTPEAKAANAYVTLTNILNSMNELGILPKRWSNNKTLSVFPFAGQDMNAYYNRECLAFFYDKDQDNDSWYFTADASDIVSHELGHALLDAYRPDLWDAASIEIWAFHEAFGDMVALLSLLQHPAALGYLLKETNGNLMKTNIASNIAEGFSRIVAQEKKDQPEAYLRSGINEFTYTDPQFLPKKTDNASLAREPHSFSRVFFGAFYDIFVTIYEHEIGTGKVPPHALTVARNTLARYLAKAVQNAPASAKFFESVAKTMLWADWTSGRVYHDKMYEVFSNRKIIVPEVNAQSMSKSTNLETGIVKVCTSKRTKLSRFKQKGVNLFSTLSNDIERSDMWMPRQEAHLYDSKGYLLSTHSVSQEETEEAAEELANYLKLTQGCTSDPHTPFEISNGQLKRTMICCGCGGGGHRTPLKSSPEFEKQYKPENNAGCCGGCRPPAQATPEKRKVLRGCFVRYKITQR